MPPDPTSATTENRPTVFPVRSRVVDALGPSGMRCSLTRIVRSGSPLPRPRHLFPDLNLGLGITRPLPASYAASLPLAISALSRRGCTPRPQDQLPTVISASIMISAGGSGDRWSKRRKAFRLEESPDSAVAVRQGNAPGNARGLG